MPTPTIAKSTTAPVAGLTGKGRAVALLVTVRDRWDSLTPDQRAEVADQVARLSVALRAEKLASTDANSVPRPLPLVGRLSA
jgi:hypothetical protein